MGVSETLRRWTEACVACNLYSAGRPSRWVLAHISSCCCIGAVSVKLLLGFVWCQCLGNHLWRVAVVAVQRTLGRRFIWQWSDVGWVSVSDICTCTLRPPHRVNTCIHTRRAYTYIYIKIEIYWLIERTACWLVFVMIEHWWRLRGTLDYRATLCKCFITWPRRPIVFRAWHCLCAPLVSGRRAQVSVTIIQMTDIL